MTWMTLGSILRRGNSFISFPKCPATGPTQSPIQGVLGIKLPAHEADHSPAPSTEAKNRWRYTSTPPVCLRGTHRDSLIYQSINPLACTECGDSLRFSGASSIPPCHTLFPATPLRRPFFHPPSLHPAIYFLVYILVLLFPDSYTILFLGILFSSILCTCPNQRNLCSLIVSVIYTSMYNNCNNKTDLNSK